MEDDPLRLFEIEAYRSWANLELVCQTETEETHNAMDEAEQEINSAGDEAGEEMNSAMDEFQGFAEELEREAMADYHSLVSTTGKMGKALEKAGLLPSSTFPTNDNVNLDELEVKLGEVEAELVEMIANSEKLQHSYNEILECGLVLLKAGEFFFIQL